MAFHARLTPISSATTLVQLPMMLAIAVCACVPGFAIGGFPWDNFITFVLAYAVNLFAFECIGQFCSLIPNPIVGMLMFMNMCASSRSPFALL